MFAELLTEDPGPVGTQRLQFLRIYKHLVGCIDCGTHAGRLDFDHREPLLKRFNVLAEVARRSWDELLQELGKCDVRCVSCHAKRHSPLPPRPKTTHCPNGHRYTPENTYVYPSRPNTGKACKTCAIERAKARYRRLRVTL